MFTDWQQAAAARTVARRATSKEDLLLLLDMCGLPGDDDTLTTLLPLLNSPEGAPHMQQSPKTPALNAFEAMALSMVSAGHPMAEITEATGLYEDEVAALVAAQRKTDANGADSAPEGPAVDDAVEQLLAWAEAHSSAGIRNKAARVRGDLSELTARRAADNAQRAAEERVAKLTAALEKAKEDLRAAKSGTHSSPSAAPTPIRPTAGKRSREDLAAIRTWARENGHQVATAGVIKASIVEAYDAAHQQPATLAKAG